MDGIPRHHGEISRFPPRTTDVAKLFRRRGDDITITDGPYAETTEQLGGFYTVEADSLDTVLRLVAHLPEYSIEIRPIDDDPGGDE